MLDEPDDVAPSADRDPPGWSLRWDLPWADAGRDVAPGRRAPRRFVWSYRPYADEPAQEVIFEVTADRATRCMSVNLSAQPDGRPIRDADRDPPLAELAEHALAHSLVRVETSEHDGRRVESITMTDPRKAPSREAQDIARRARQRGHRRIDDRTLIRVAEVYRRALHDGRPPTAAVRDAFQVSHRTAGNYIKQAREREFLGPARGRGKAGEATDTTTTTDPETDS